MGEHATLEVCPVLAFYEAGDRSPLRSRSGEEGEELLSDDLVQERLFGLVAGVVDDGESSVGTETRGRSRTPIRLSQCGEMNES